jgi:hypothetical protein
VLKDGHGLDLLHGAEFLSLFMPGVFEAPDVHFLVVLDDFASVAHLLDC